MTTKDNAQPVLVTGATGRQGGAVARALLAQGTPVRALVRDLQSPAAAALQTLGASLALGNFDDRESLLAACTGARAVFSVHSPNMADLHAKQALFTHEMAHGKNLVEAALAAHVPQFIHTSVSGAGEHHRNAPGWKETREYENYWESKAYIDELVRTAGFPYWTVLKPAFFMENFVRPSFLFENFVGDRWLTVLAPQTELALVPVQDIGAACAAAINHPEKFNHVDLELASDFLPMRKIVAILAEVWGQPMEAPSLSPAEAIARGLDPAFVNSQIRMNEVGSPARPAQAQSLGIVTTDFKTWAKHKWPAGRAAD